MVPALEVSAEDQQHGSGPKPGALSPGVSKILKTWRENVTPGFGTFPVVVDSAHGHTIKDVDGKEYIDMISQFAVSNFGHSHPKIVEAVVDQIRKVALVNTSYVHPLYAELAERLNKKFGYDSIAAMVTGSEAIDACVKIARKWAYVKKKIPANEAWILTTDCCYHGVTLITMNLSNVKAENFGKHIPHVGPFGPTSGRLVRYGNVEDLQQVLEESGHQIAAFMIEPIQGLAGTKIPPEGYLKAAQDLCQKHNVLFICDEIQTGLGRTGTDLAYQHESVKPDLVALGKAITGGVVPMSIVMGKREVMEIIQPYDVASTYAGMPAACAAALAALDVLEDEAISARSQRLGQLLAELISSAGLPYVLEHRGCGRGLFQTLVIDEVPSKGITARRIAALCALRGVLCGNTANRLRFSPPLTISEEALAKAVEVLSGAFSDVATLGEFPGSNGLD
ncbi:related to ornithine aminotransferase [Cephalotrichum gorgonifer]|uniref:Ornithine aminotransferase n=1 Tax=Cephalotrichum gorgonifer TaxID=2041049 RepID=A0AAE8N587_9PEZI|nr:related to ornithine aminotransferase [Cephalotrichum gorgonifer]